MRSEPRLCPTKCGRNVRRGHLMCGPCWRLLPAELQRPVWATWRRFLATGEGFADYQAARADALEAVEQIRGPKPDGLFDA